MSWQDPVALLLALSLLGLSLWWRRWLIKRGSAPQCAKCRAGQMPQAPPKPTVVEVGRMRLSRKR